MADEESVLALFSSFFIVCVGVAKSVTRSDKEVRVVLKPEMFVLGISA